MLVGGLCPDYPSYRSLCGQVKMLDETLELIDELKHRLVLDDDDSS